MIVATRHRGITKMVDLANHLHSQEHLHLTSLTYNEHASTNIQLQTPTPPDSPTSTETPVWCQNFQHFSDSTSFQKRVSAPLPSSIPTPNADTKISDVTTTGSIVPTPPTNTGLNRALRSTRHRRSSITLPWPTKRLFTPDIKRMLKSWLVRRRDNPYPSRSEKEALAGSTGLTYMQICNWFANWRRKLRNSSKAVTTTHNDSASHSSGGSVAATATWGRLIKRYNAQACAATAAEQFSISSNDSIWGADSSTDTNPEKNQQGLEERLSRTEAPFNADHCYTPRPRTNSIPAATAHPTTPRRLRMSSSRSRRRRRRRRFLGTTPSMPIPIPSTLISTLSTPPSPHPSQERTPLLTKWLESAAKYRPSLPWAVKSTESSANRQVLPEQNRRSVGRSRPKKIPFDSKESSPIQGRHREELDAAEALTRLSVMGAPGGTAAPHLAAPRRLPVHN